MKYLVDTNVLLRLVQRSHAHHDAARRAVLRLRREQHSLFVAAQNCVEFWNVATRPAERNGLGLTISQTDKHLRIIERLFPILPESATLYPEWRRLVVQFGVSGVQVHDARLVAAIKTEQVTHLLTFNTQDFLRYADDGIVAVDPRRV